MQQQPLPMLTWYVGPTLVDHGEVRACTTYREAVRQCWERRMRRNMTKRTLAEEAGLYAPHVTDYLSAGDKRRALPAEYIDAVEIACGNRFISQWIALRANLPITVQVERRAA